jgi:hypothetical protein
MVGPGQNIHRQSLRQGCETAPTEEQPQAEDEGIAIPVLDRKPVGIFLLLAIAKDAFEVDELPLFKVLARGHLLAGLQLLIKEYWQQFRRSAPTATASLSKSIAQSIDHF